jgi:prepilin-type N-terminal cleavage/methylation domain-containing protein
MQKSRNGFTLIEVLVAVTIISVLSVVAVSFVSLSRDRAKDAKVQQEKVLVKGVIEAYAAERGGYPNLNPGDGPRMYCVGSTDCYVNGRQVTDYMNPVTGTTDDTSFQIGDLIGFTNEADQLSQGFVYVSCGSEEPTCDDASLIYPQSDYEYISYFNNDPDDPIDDDFDFFTSIGINIDDYLLVNTSDNPDSGTYPYTCRESDYTQFYGAFSLGSCVNSSQTGKWYCNTSCSSVIGQYSTCSASESGAYAASPSCEYAASQAGNVYYCTDTCNNVHNQYPINCNAIFDPDPEGSHCYYGNDNLYHCTDVMYCSVTCDNGNPYQDCDHDNYPNGQDTCPGATNTGIDNDGDGIDSVCDPSDEPDNDADGVPDSQDVCAGYNDYYDADQDGIPDGCDFE